MKLDEMYADFKEEVISMTEYMFNENKQIPPGFFILVKCDAMRKMVNAKAEVSVEGFKEGKIINKLKNISTEARDKMNGFKGHKDVVMSMLPIEIFFRASDVKTQQLHKDAAEIFIQNFIIGIQQHDIDGVVCCAFVSEGWMGSLSIDAAKKLEKEGKGFPLPSQNPDREEGIFINFETKIHVDFWARKIKRMGDLVELEPILKLEKEFDLIKHGMKSPGNNAVNGRFGDFLTPPEITSN